jgi:hypothetical protein
MVEVRRIAAAIIAEAAGAGHPLPSRAVSFEPVDPAA